MEAVPTSTSSTSSVTSSADGRGAGSGGSSDYLNLGMFAQSGGGVGDTSLLLGAGGVSGGGGGLWNGYGNDANSVNSAGGGGNPSSSGGSGSSAFDLNDFPSLGGGAAGAPGAPASAPGSNGLAAALRQQQQILAHQQMLRGAGAAGASNAVSKSSNLYRLAMSSGANGAGANFNMATEDFPALPGAPVGSNANGNVSGPANSPLILGGNGGGSAGNVGFTSRSGLYNGDGMIGESNSNPLEGGGLLGGGGLGVLGGLTSSSNPGSAQQGHQRSSTQTSLTSPVGGSSNPAGGSAAGAGSALSGDFGLLGLLGVIRMTDADRQSLAMGSDLTLLGLNMNTNDQLYSTFASPWSESPASKEPQYQLPMCYYMQPPALKTGHLSKFQLETLFYIFYALPKDVLQAYSAQELYSREWRYNGDLKLWFKQAGPADGVSSSASGGAQYLYFDISSWERRLFSGNIQNITSGFLSEEDIRVKFPNS